jgi:hypothetical protein
MAIFREDEPDTRDPSRVSAFQGGDLVDSSTAATKAMRAAAQRAMERGSETDDWVGLIGTIIGGAAAAAIPGIGPAAALGIGASTGAAAQGATKVIEGKERGGGEQVATGIAGIGAGLKGTQWPKAAPGPPSVPGEDPLGELYPETKDRTKFESLLGATPRAASPTPLPAPNLNPAFLRKK